MRPRHLIPALVVGVLALILTTACQQAAAPVEELKAGIGIPLSGASAPVGIAAGRTFELVAEDIGVFEVAGKKYRWKTLNEDNLYTSAGGVQSANKFINQENVKLMFQFGSAAGNAVQPIAEAAKVLYDGASSDKTFLGPKFKYTFRSYQTPTDTFPGLIGYLKKTQPQLKNWYTLVADDASGAAVEQSSKPVVSHFGLNLVGSSSYTRGTNDFYPILVKVLVTKPDVIITMAADTYGTLVKQAREQGYTGKFVMSGWPPKVVEVAGAKNAEGSIVPDADMWSDKSPKGLLDFAKKYKDRYGEEWPANMRITFPTLYLVTDAMKQAGTAADNEKIAKTMETSKLSTPLGTMFYGEEAVYGTPHQLVWPLWISEFKDGKLQTVATLSSEEAVKAVEEVFK